MDQVDPTRILNRLTFGLYVEHWREGIETWGFADWSSGDGLVLLVLWNHMTIKTWGGQFSNPCDGMGVWILETSSFQWTWAAASCEIRRSFSGFYNLLYALHGFQQKSVHIFVRSPFLGGFFRLVARLPGCPVGKPTTPNWARSTATSAWGAGGGQTLEQLLPTRFL